MKNVLPGLGLGCAIGLLVAPGPGRLRQRFKDWVSPGEQDQNESSILYILNSAPREDLLATYGLGSVIVDQIVQNRPFASEQQLVENNVVPESNFDHLRRQLRRKRIA